MTKIETIIAEIKQRVNKYEDDHDPVPMALKSVLGFINSLPTAVEQPSENLEEDIESYLTTNRQYAGGDEEDMWGDDCIRDAIKHGAQWQKEQDKALIEKAEDHAKLAGIALGEKEAEEKFINKACEWLNKNVVEYHPRTGELRPVVNINAFREAMEKEDEQ